MEAITIQELKDRHARLFAAREANQKEIRNLQASLEEAQRREHGFMFVLGEIESMVAELNAREAERVKAEQEAAEAERVKAEQEAEAERVKAELEAEAERVAAELQAEADRIAAEQEAENQRATAKLQAEVERFMAEREAAERGEDTEYVERDDPSRNRRKPSHAQ